MRVSESTVVELNDPSAVAALRHAVNKLALTSGIAAGRRGELALVVTEAGNNAVNHGGGGQALVHRVGEAIRVVVTDEGAGMANVSKCLRDGYSTAGTPGHGLGTIERLSSGISIATAADRGTIVDIRFGNTPPKNSNWDFGALVRALAGEARSGDAVAYREAPDGRLLVAVIDALGHGPRANDSAEAAVVAFEEGPFDALGAVEAIHRALKGLRGAVLGVAQFEADHADVVLLGNIDAFVFGPDRERRVTATNGTAGQSHRTLVPQRISLADDETFVMHTDGLRRVRAPRQFPGITNRPASTIAALLYRDHRRRTDDAGIAVVRRSPR